MKVLSHDKDGAVIRASWDELAIMYFGAGEAVRNIDDWEFPTIVGAPVDLAKALRGELGDVLKRELSTSKD